MEASSPVLLGYVALAVFAAGIVRGATGFGFSMIMIVLLTLVCAPAEAAPVILLWEVFASLAHLPFVYRQVDWKALRWLALGVLAGTPPGVYFLVAVPVEPMRIAINAVVLVLTALLFRGQRPQKAPGRAGTAGVGLLSGVINGASANGGPPIILFFLSGPAGAAVGRASLIAFFLFTDTWASLLYWQQGLMHARTLLSAVIFAVPLGLGMAVGSRWFARVDERRFRQCVLCLLMGIAVVGLVRSCLAL